MVQSRRPSASTDEQLLYLTAIIVGDQGVYPSLCSPFVLAWKVLDRWALLDSAIDSLPTVKGY